MYKIWDWGKFIGVRHKIYMFYKLPLAWAFCAIELSS
jgi:hypothetical protein